MGARADLAVIGYQQALSHNWLDSLPASTDLVTDLRTFTGITAPSTNGTGNIGSMVFARGQSSPGDGFGGLFYWNATSSASDDGATVIKPTAVSGAGRWLLLEFSALTPSSSENSTKLATTAYVKAQGYITGNQTITLSGDVSGSGTTAITVTLAANAVTNAKAAQGTSNSVKGNPSNIGANEQDMTMPSCAGATNGLSWTNGTGFGCNTYSAAQFLRSYLAGLGTTNDSISPNTKLDIAPGVAADATNAVYIALPPSFTKTTGGAWTAGSGNNGMGNGLTIANNTQYDVCLAYNGGTPDIWFDTSNRSTTYSECANKPSGISGSLYRRIWWFKTDGSAHIIPYTQFGDELVWVTPVTDQNAQTASTSGALATLASVPTGFKVQAEFSGSFDTAATIGYGLFYAGDTTSPPVPSNTTANAVFPVPGSAYGAGAFTMRTTTAGQVGERISASGTFNITTYGFIDRRGRDN
jgi:hypothetical protein